MKKITIHGNTIRRCDLDSSLCNQEKCTLNNSMLCSESWDNKVCMYALELSTLIAEHAISAAFEDRKLGSEHIESAKRIIELNGIFS